MDGSTDSIPINSTMSFTLKLLISSYTWNSKMPHTSPHKACTITIIFCLFCCFTSQVNSYGHGGTVSSPNHNLSWASLNKRLTSLRQYFVHILLLVTDNNPSWMEENDLRNYFMVNLHESMGPSLDQTSDPWICSQTRICSQTCYWLGHRALRPTITITCSRWYYQCQMVWIQIRTDVKMEIHAAKIQTVGYHSCRNCLFLQ